MCDKTFTILKDFVLSITSGRESEQMMVEDRVGGDMYFRFLIKELEENQSGNIQFEPYDDYHAVFTLEIPKGARVQRTEPMYIGTYGQNRQMDPGENTGLYLVYEVTPVLTDGVITYSVHVQFQIKGGE